ncbi:hypothetical protein [Pseudooceanicola atlanticus]|uniref:hypothetical protein n=1 Tax=Pseudooceanicola atlanticus TaxID=1461694 RepID=UPI0012E03169|nr:hypothetical protein [Pseudooceanicola atlanticus]
MFRAVAAGLEAQKPCSGSRPHIADEKTRKIELAVEIKRPEGHSDLSGHLFQKYRFPEKTILMIIDIARFDVN